MFLQEQQPHYRWHWLQAAVAASGGLGLFLVAFLDSSFIPLPVLTDLLVIDLSSQNPYRMPYYALMSTIGSVLGCVTLFYIAKRSGEALFHKHAGERAHHFHRWVVNNGFLTLIVAALMPPPMPFKVIVIAAGVFEMPIKSFVSALIIARSIRYFGEGYLAIKYGEQAKHFLRDHKISMSLITLGCVLVIYVAIRLILRRPKPVA
jgi:membrane protein YqaA with SNARE-associated domain